MSKINELVQTLCPDGVKYKKLGEVAEYARSRIPATDVDENTYVGVDNLLQNCRGVKESANVPADGTVIQFLKKDILIGNIRPYLKKAWLADRDGGTNGDVLAIRVKDENEISPDFLYAILSSDAFFEYDMLYSKGAKMPRGDKNAVMMYELPVPPLPVQDEIVRILDEYTDLEAELEAKLSEEIELKQKQYEVYRDELLTFGDDVERKSLKNIFKSIRNGFVGTVVGNFSDSGNGVRYLEGKNVHNGHISNDDKVYVTREFDEKHKNGRLEAGAIVMVQSGHVGESAVIPVELENSNCHALIIMDGIDKSHYNSYFINYYFQTHMGKRALKKLETGGTIKHINSSKMKDFIVPVPSITEQERIVKILDKYDTYTRDMISTLNTELESRKKQYAYYRDQLLTFKRKE